MKTHFYLVLIYIFFSKSLSAKIFLTRSPIKNSSCTYELLNPHIGADIYQATCPQKLSLLDAEESITWKIFSTKRLIVEEPNDTESHDQWGLESINAKKFWDTRSIGSRNVKVAIIDTGINYLHEDLLHNLGINPLEFPLNGVDDDHNGYIDDYYGWDAANNSNDPMDIYDHGTHIAGIIGASTNNELGITGINWNVTIIPVKFVDNQGGGRTESAIRAIDYAVARGAKIINLSWGGVNRSPLLQEVIKRSQENGVLFIAAAGNEARDNDITPTYPASYPLDNIISVASIDFRNNLSWFSNWGEKSVHVAAPGESILSTVGRARYGFKDGTSMATPHITGVAALLLSAHPDWSYHKIRNYILNSCQKSDAKNLPVSCGGNFSF